MTLILTRSMLISNRLLLYLFYFSSVHYFNHDFSSLAKRRRVISRTLLSRRYFFSCHVRSWRDFHWKTRVSLCMQLLVKQLNWCLQFLYILRDERVLICMMFFFWVKLKTLNQLQCYLFSWMIFALLFL